MNTILTFAFLTSMLGYVAQGTQILGLRSNNLWGILYMASFIITAFSSHLWFNAIERGCLMVLFVFSYLFWHHESWKYRFKFWHVAPYALIFILMYAKLHNSDASPLLDASTATLGLTGTILVSMRNKYAFVIFFICNGVEAIMFFKLGGTLISLGIMESVFCLSNIPAFMIWSWKGVHK